MKFQLLEETFRNKEKSSTNKLKDGCFYVVRVDGKGFSQLTKKHFHKPFSDNFQKIMIKTVESVITKYNLNISFAYFQSDEISFFINSKNKNNKERKLISLIPSAVSLEFNKHCSLPNVNALFDARLIELSTIDEVINYFDWRCLDAKRNSINTSVYWEAVNSGASFKKASKFLHNSDYNEKMKFLYEECKIDYKKYPSWCVFGSITFFSTYNKLGYNPIERKEVTVQRRKISTKELNSEEDLLNFLKNYFKI